MTSHVFVMFSSRGKIRAKEGGKFLIIATEAESGSSLSCPVSLEGAGLATSKRSKSSPVALHLSSAGIVNRD